MCGIGGVVSLNGDPIPQLERRLNVFNVLLIHRGPDDEGTWVSDDMSVGLAHRRLSIIDLSPAGRQPMIGEDGNVIVYNGEIYNHIELREELKNWEFRTRTDTEVILAAYSKWGKNCLDHFRGMFAFAIWDSRKKLLFCARDRFGIKPFYYILSGNYFVFASEAKALLPWLPSLNTNPEAFSEYLVFQSTIGEHTLFDGINQLLPGHALVVENGKVDVWRYWDVAYRTDFDHTQHYFIRRLREIFDESVRLHLRSDVPVGSYLSGGIDSSLVAILASQVDSCNSKAFHGRFVGYPGYDESFYAKVAAEAAKKELYIIDIKAQDFVDYFPKVIYFLDFPVAGPGSFPQYMVSWLASRHVKVVLGGQGGDEIFGGYVRYLLAYFEQCIKAAIDGTYLNGNYVVTIESIIPNLGVLREYKGMIQSCWKEGLFGPLDERYFRLIDKSRDMDDVIEWDYLDRRRVYQKFKQIFNSSRNVGKEAYFDKMTHFDFKCLLPALLHVEDRVSMAHGLESRVPFLDHKLVEFVAQVPADIKFEGGRMKNLLKNAYSDLLPPKILARRDKMGFPVPLHEWLTGELKEFFFDIFSSSRAQARPFIRPAGILKALDTSHKFGRKLWALMCIEIWYQQFHDKHHEYRKLLS